MNDIFHIIRDGTQVAIQNWLDNIENDISIVDDHGFSLLHWACWDGRLNIVDLILKQGGKIDCVNNANDTPLHEASKHGHLDVVNYLIKNKAPLNVTNTHGNTPLHYACHFGYTDICKSLVQAGANLALLNKYSKTPLDLARSTLKSQLEEYAKLMNINLTPVPFKTKSISWSRTFSNESSILSQSSIDVDEIIPDPEPGLTYQGQWQSMDVIIKCIKVKKVYHRDSNAFSNEYKKLRIFNNTNILPIFTASLNKHLLIVTQFLKYGSLMEFLPKYNETPKENLINFAIHIARGMNFLHSHDPSITLNYDLNSRHVVICDDLIAKISLSDYKFSMTNRAKISYPAWIAPEALKSKPNETNKASADMWSFGIILWELHTKKVPFSDYVPMLLGRMIANDGLRIEIPSDMSTHMAKLIRICMNEEPLKRPRFDMVIPILEKLK
jgi:integrin-linked kinase